MGGEAGGWVQWVHSSTSRSGQRSIAPCTSKILVMCGVCEGVHPLLFLRQTGEGLQRRAKQRQRSDATHARTSSTAALLKPMYSFPNTTASLGDAVQLTLDMGVDGRVTAGGSGGGGGAAGPAGTDGAVTRIPPPTPRVSAYGGTAGPPAGSHEATYILQPCCRRAL